MTRYYHQGDDIDASASEPTVDEKEPGKKATSGADEKGGLSAKTDTKQSDMKSKTVTKARHQKDHRPHQHRVSQNEEPSSVEKGSVCAYENEDEEGDASGTVSYQFPL
jgi:hypothetical protein